MRHVTTTDVSQLVGKLILREDEEYDAARVSRVFNRRLPERRPAAVLQAATEQDVVLGVALAKERGWKIAVRSGGHSWAQWSVRNNALVLDLGGLQEMTYDASTGVATASPAVRGGMDLDPFLAQHGRFFYGGHCPTVGIGGFLLQGGQGWTARGHGWAAECVVGLDVVTADAELVHCTAEENPDLYWAARGAGPGFFGIVTRFHLQTVPRFQALYETLQAFQISDFDDVMTWVQGMHHTLAPSVELVCVAATEPVADAVEPLVSGSEPLVTSGRHVLFVSAVAFVESEAEAQEALAPLRANPFLDRALLSVDTAPVTLDQLRQKQLDANPEGHRWAVDNAWIEGSADEVVPAIRDAYTTLPTPQAFTIWFSMAPLRELPDMAFSLQSDIYLASYVLWKEEEDDERCIAWLADVMTKMEPVTIGLYLGDSDLSRKQNKFMSDKNWARLQQIRAERDPDALFVGYLAGDGATNRNAWE